MKLIQTGGSTPLVEITLRCYTLCYWCYKKKLAHPKAAHVPFELLEKRIKWIARYVECSSIGLLGGEPLLHPDFIKICSLIISQGKKVVLITSGKISNDPIENRNWEYALELYEQGLMEINLSFQPDKNERAYCEFLKEIIKKYQRRREALTKLGEYYPLNHDLFTVVVINEALANNKGKLLKLVNFLFKESNFKQLSRGGEMFSGLLESLKKHYASFEESSVFSYEFTAKDNVTEFRHKFAFHGETVIDKHSDTVRSPKGGMCEALKITVDKNRIDVPTMIVRSDGDICTATAKCIPMKNGFCNTDIHLKKDEIVGAFKSSIAQIRTMVFIANRKKAADNCDANGKEVPCTSCPFDNICTSCHGTERNWNKE